MHRFVILWPATVGASYRIALCLDMLETGILLKVTTEYLSSQWFWFLHHLWSIDMIVACWMQELGSSYCGVLWLMAGSHGITVLSRFDSLVILLHAHRRIVCYVPLKTDDAVKVVRSY